MPKSNTSSKTPKDKKAYWIVAVLGVLLVAAIAVIVYLVLSHNVSTNNNVTNVDNDSNLSSNADGNTSKNEINKDEYGKNNPIIMITDRNTPVITSEKDGHFVQTAEVNMYCDLQDGYEISNVSGKAYKGNKFSTSQMDFEYSQNYRKYSQYGSVALICTGHGSYRKSDKWELSHHYLKIDYDNITEDGRFTFTEEAWLNPDGSTKEFRDFANKLIRILPTTDDAPTLVLEDYHVKMHFILNREAQDFLTEWRRLIDTL